MKIGNPKGSIVPLVGTSGPFKMDMFRGLATDILERNGHRYRSDAGDYGRGEYWIQNRAIARAYGKVIAKTIRLTNALHLESNEIVILARDVYGTTMNKGKNHCTFEAAGRLTKDMLAKGHDGIVVCGYEYKNVWSACVFSKE